MNDPMPFRRPDPPSSLSVARAIIAQAKAAIDRSVRPIDYASVTWPRDDDAKLLLRAAQTPTLLSSAAALVPVRQAFAEALKSLTASGELINQGISLTSFDGGQVQVPGFAPGESSFVAEGEPIPVRQLVSSGPTLSPFKLATIVALSIEMMDHTDADVLVRAAILESIGLGLDRAIFSADVASAASPAGILYGISPSTPAGASAKDEAMATDVATLLTAIAAVSGGGFLIVAAPPQAVALQLRLGREVPNVKASSALEAGTVVAVATKAFVSILETPRVDASIEGLIHMEDATPLPISSSPSAVAAPARSLFQTASVGLKMVTPSSWGLRASGAVAYMTGVIW